jgi:tyrosyl-tRNA synthetase
MEINKVYELLTERKLIFQSTSQEIFKIMDREAITFYVGFDMTASSLHLGHCLQLKTICRLVSLGHHGIILFGSFTSRIGDPHGKNKERQVLSAATIEENKKSIKAQVQLLVEKYINKESKGTISFVDNNQWLEGIKYGDFLNDVARFTSVNQMIKIESASVRLAQQLHLSLLEFNYMILQAMDFHHLYINHNCLLQIGGSDQWGNIIMGVNLVQSKENQEVFGITLPLLTTGSGKKMGKTEDGAIWLDGNLCTPYTMWQYLRNVGDNDITDLLLRLSDLSVEEIENLSRDKNINEMKIILADQVVRWIHGEEALRIIKGEIERQFNQANNNNKERIFNIAEIQNSPSAAPFSSNIINNIEVEDLLFLTSLVTSKSEARRKILESAVKINGEICQFTKEKVTMNMFPQGVLCLEMGKKQRRYIFIQNNS